LIDVEALLEPVSPDAPCGEDLEYGAVDALSRAAQVVPEQQMGDTVVPAQEPDWDAVRKQALDICKVTKDLRVAVTLANAAARTQGWSGFADALAYLDGLLERYWVDVHPQLDPDEPDDFTLRVNLVASLADGDTTLTYLREAPLVQSVMGRFSLHEMLVAEGVLSHVATDEEPPPDRALIDAAIRAADVDQLSATRVSVKRAENALADLEARLMSLVGAASAPDMSALSTLIKRALRALDEGSGLHSEAAVALTEEATTGGPQGAALSSATAGAGDIRGPDDVRRALQALCTYYRKQEPSSPIPILLERALSLISKDFYEIMKNLAPDSLAAVDQIRGPQPDAEDSGSGSEW